MGIEAALLKARELISKGWCQKAFGRNELGRATPVNSPAACSFCLVGALESVDAPQETKKLLAESLPVGDLRPRRIDFLALTGIFTGYNDRPTTTKDDVLKLIDTTLEKLK